MDNTLESYHKNLNIPIITTLKRVSIPSVIPSESPPKPVPKPPETNNPTASLIASYTTITRPSIFPSLQSSKYLYKNLSLSLHQA